MPRHLTLLAALAVATLPASARAADFGRDVLGFVRQHCAACHNDKQKKADLSLDAFTSEASLIPGRDTWDAVLEQVASGAMPPHGKPRPSVESAERFRAAVQGIFEKHDRTAKPDPGRVTARRLNRAEYRNTIRDLLAVDFDPSGDFPSDGVGHGFDNIGDVLSVSPVHLERYLSAAEGIAAQAIAAPVPSPSERWQGGRYLDPEIDAEVEFRALDKSEPPLHTPFNVSLAGTFRFRVQMYGESPDGTPPEVAFLADWRGVGQQKVELSKGKVREYEVTLTLPKGEHRLALKLLNPDAGNGKRRSVHVGYFNLTGPADMRPESHKRLLGDDPAPLTAERARAAVARFARRAYRRPVSAAEADALFRFAQDARADGESWEAAVRHSVAAALVSPKFLFRLEPDPQPNNPEPHPIGPFALASRLSYFLWASTPDEELLRLAEEGRLERELEPQVRRMLRDPKSEALVERFAMQWLQLDRVASLQPDLKTFPQFNENLKRCMIRETKLFLAEIIREDRRVTDLIDADFTYANNVMSWHYGLKDTAGNHWSQREPHVPGGKEFTDEFVRVKLLPSTNRGGLLTHASVLLATSNPTRTSPVKRGRWVLEQILGTPPPPAPPDVPELADQKQLTGTLRQRMEQHRANPSCAGCHARMDPIGFAFENFDATGRYRWEDEKKPIDASGTLPGGKKFDGPGGLKRILLESKDGIARNLAEKVLTYALGRGLEHYDRRAVAGIVDATRAADYRISALIVGTVKSDPFRLRRGGKE